MFNKCAYTIVFMMLFHCQLVAAPVDAMQKSTVRVVCKKGESAGTGSGFITGGGDYIVTNHHVIDCANSGGEIRILFPHEGRVQNMAATVVWQKDTPDLAFLKTAQRLPYAEVTFQLNIAVGDAVWAVGFPGAADDFGEDLQDFIVPTVTDGRVSRFIGSGEHKKIQISAPINPGNSGGPAFDDHGNVIAINTLKSLATVATLDGNDGQTQRVTQGEGIGASIPAALIMSALDEQHIHYKLAPVVVEEDISAESHDSIQQNTLNLNIATLLLVLISTTYMFIKLRTPQARQAIQDSITKIVRKEAHLPNKNISVQKALTGYLRGVEGQYQGCELALDNQSLVIGRDAKLSQLVVDSALHPSVSKRHCAITYQADQRTFILEDYWSTNGTYLNNQIKRLTPNTKHKLKAGDTIMIGDAGLTFELLEGET